MEGFDFSLITNYGAIGVVLGYFIYKDHVTMKELKDTVAQLKEVVIILKERVKA